MNGGNAARLAVSAAAALFVATLPLFPALAADEPTVAAESLLVGPASGHNLSAAIVARTRAILIADLASQCASCVLIDRGGQPLSMPLDSAGASASLAESPATAVLSLDVRHGPNQTRFSLAVFRRGPAGAVVEPEVLTEDTSAGPEAVDLVVHTLVTRFFQRLADSSPAFAASARRTLFFGGSIGGLVQFNSAAARDRLLPAFSLSILHSTATSLIDGRFEYAAADGAERAAVGFAYAARFGNHWSVGGAATWVLMGLGGRGASGVAVEPMLGWLVGPADAPRLHVEAGYTFNLFKEQAMDRLIPGSDARHWSHGPQLWFGVLL